MAENGKISYLPAVLVWQLETLRSTAQSFLQIAL